MNFNEMCSSDPDQIANWLSGTEQELSNTELKALLMNAFIRIERLSCKAADLQDQIRELNPALN